MLWQTALKELEFPDLAKISIRREGRLVYHKDYVDMF